MPRQPLTIPERSVLTALAALNELPGSMLNRSSLWKHWCGASAGRQAADLERAVESLLGKGMLRENAYKTKIGFTIAGYDQITN